ncbi:MAG: DnaJ domain-containing protein [Chloroflexota bacterium]|nr:DnaJ domain-containing protein [Chloroflexota bacterium]
MKQAPDYYAILQVDSQAEREVIQAAYRRLAAKYHPDVDASPGSTERMRLLNAAYEVLSHPDKRRAYDLSRRGPRWQAAGPAPQARARRWPVWWLLPAAVVIIAALRFNPRLALVLGFLSLVVWLFNRWQASKR